MQEGRGKLESLVREKGKLAFLSAPGGPGGYASLKVLFQSNFATTTTQAKHRGKLI